MIRVGVVGATGRMGREVCRAVDADPELALVAAVSRAHAGEPLSGAAGIDTDVVLASRLDEMIDAKVEVSVDFTGPAYAPEHVTWAIAHGVHVVVGTTGFAIEPSWGEQDRIGVIVAPNFAIGAVLMMRFAESAARYLPAAEIVELHHDGKRDAPSGTALRTAERIAEARRTAAQGTSEPDPFEIDAHPGARGADVDGVRVHSVRLPGLLAHQEVILGGPGQTLTIRHDSTDRISFMPGVLLAIRAAPTRPGLTVGLDPLLAEA